MLIVNGPHKFSEEEMSHIVKHKGKMVTNSVKMWSKYFPQAEPLKHMGPFNLRVQKGRLYSSATSPMIAISYAMQQGATEIILYGCDFKNHPKYQEGTKHGDHEIGIYKRFFESCDKLGTRIYLGEWGSVFDGHLWKYVDHVEGSITGHEFLMKVDNTQGGIIEKLPILDMMIDASIKHKAK